jgi:hypothetical protein
LISKQINISFAFQGSYPTLHDVKNNKHYVGFESIYEFNPIVNVSICFLLNKQKN